MIVKRKVKNFNGWTEHSGRNLLTKLHCNLGITGYFAAIYRCSRIP